VAIKRDAFRDLALCNKMFDFIGLRKPAIVSRTRSVEEYFDESCFRFFRAGDERDLARAIREVHADPGLREALANRAAVVANAYSWPLQRQRYLQIIDALARREQPAPEAPPRAEPRSAAEP
jgi:glycosyltransferase involved in cell wall biosynthesis